MSDDEYEDAVTEEVTGIPEFKWRNARGEEGWATFNDPDDLTGRDIRSLRNTITDAGGGPVSNAFMARALQLLVAEWHVPMPNGKPSPVIPRLDRTNKVLDSVPGKFLVALEDHVRPHLDFIKPRDEDDDGMPGSPPRPARG